MALFTRISLFIVFVFFGLTIPSFAFADAKSDYDYQLRQYRQSYSEYLVLKNDYLGNPTLDNQQKAILAARQSVENRDLAKASFAGYLLELIAEKKATYDPVQSIVNRLVVAKSFYLSSASKAQSIITPVDLKTFTDSYLEDTKPHDKSLKYGIFSNKILTLVRFQLDCKNSLDIILPKLPDPPSVPLKVRVEELQNLGSKINKDIDTLATKIIPLDELESVVGDGYFTQKIEKIQEIRSQQVSWIDKLIDIDINYVQPKN